ncbi:unnamed protein product [Brugia pahangi]|uniref:Uncharacterized protein n=1 Tax=Brugia pahangi TaxID=6280 RepID=A0A0N4TZ67_BRUPA|nr:unnamed protein product [Brugia pahangi]
MDGCVAGAFDISLVVDALCSHSRGINRRALTLSLMVLSCATLILSSSDATTTIEPETTIVTEFSENSESESHQKFIISESTQTLLASTIGRKHISGYIKNSSFSNTQMMKIARKNEMHKNGQSSNYFLITFLNLNQNEKLLELKFLYILRKVLSISGKVSQLHRPFSGRTYLYILVIICIACGLVSMTIFSLLYFHFILPSP